MIMWLIKAKLCYSPRDFLFSVDPKDTICFSLLFFHHMSLLAHVVEEEHRLIIRKKFSFWFAFTFLKFWQLFKWES